jgi:hypothetical protein
MKTNTRYPCEYLNKKNINNNRFCSINLSNSMYRNSFVLIFPSVHMYYCCYLEFAHGSIALKTSRYVLRCTIHCKDIDEQFRWYFVAMINMLNGDGYLIMLSNLYLCQFVIPHSSITWIIPYILWNKCGQGSSQNTNLTRACSVSCSY